MKVGTYYGASVELLRTGVISPESGADYGACERRNQGDSAQPRRYLVRREANRREGSSGTNERTTRRRIRRYRLSVKASRLRDVEGLTLENPGTAKRYVSMLTGSGDEIRTM